MKNSDLAELLGLAALWGASFLFVRMGAAEFGPIALAALRVIGAALFLMPLLAMRGVAPMAVAAGSQLAAALVLALPAAMWWPSAAPSGQAWLTAMLLAVFCTGVAYLLYFRLIAHIGPANAIAVTFLIPAFAVLWGWLILRERLAAPMVFGCAVILLGTGLATGLLKWRRGRTARVG